MRAAMILTGAPGAGKSSVLEALATQLEIDEIPFGAVESEALGRGWPWLGFDDVVAQLGAVAALQEHAGRDALLVVATTETEGELRAVIEAVAAEHTVVVCLTAPAELVASRVAAREPDEWPGKRELVDRSRLLAEQIPSIAGIDVLISTVDRGAAEVANEIKELLVARGLLSRP